MHLETMILGFHLVMKMILLNNNKLNQLNMKKIFTLAAAVLAVSGAFAAETAYDLSFADLGLTLTPKDGATIDLSNGGGATLGIGGSLADGYSLNEANLPETHLTSEEANFNEPVTITSFMGMYFVAQLPDGVEVDTNGVYTWAIPQGLFGDADFIDGNGGHANEATNIVFTVEGGKDPNAATSVTVLSVTPASGNVLKGLTPGDVFTFETDNNSAIDHCTISFTDLNPRDPNEAVVVSTVFNHNFGDGPIVWEYSWPWATEFLEGHQYEMVVEFYANWQGEANTPLLGQASAIYEGSTAAYAYSDINLVSIDPEEGTMIDSLNFTSTLTFDGPVQIVLGNNKSAFKVSQFEMLNLTAADIAYSNDNKSVAITWPKDYLNGVRGQATLSLYVTDMEGQSLFFGSDSKENSYMTLSYGCNFGAPALVVTPGAGKVTELSKIEVTCPTAADGIMALAWYGARAFISDKSGDVVYYEFKNETEPVGEDYVSKDGAEGYTKYVFTINPPITAPGYYRFNIEGMYFDLGHDMDSCGNQGTFTVYTIENAPESEVVYDFTPDMSKTEFKNENGAIEVMLYWPEMAQSSEKFYQTVIRDEAGNFVCDIQGDAYSWDVDELFGFTVAASYIEPGKTYYAVIPAGCLGTSEWQDSNFLKGSTNPETTVYFTSEGVVDENTGVAAISAANADEVVYDLNGVRVNGKLDKGVYIRVANGKATKVLVK